MHVYHGTTPEHAHRFVQLGIDANVLYPRSIHGPQDAYPGIFVTPILEVARRFGLYIVQIEVSPDDLTVPPNIEKTGASLDQSLSDPFEPQAFLSRRVEPQAIQIVERHENGYAFNPYETQSLTTDEPE